MRAVIIGNGIAGITAAIRIREKRPDWQVTVISGESTYPYSRPALMYVFMGHMRFQDTKPYADSFWREHRIELVRDWVVEIDTRAKQLQLYGGPPLEYDKLLVATGSKPNDFGWPGKNLEGVQGLYGLMDLHALYGNVKMTERAVIVGGGLIGIELAEMLHSRGIQVTILVREDSYWDNVLPAEESGMVNDVIREAGIELRLRTVLGEIVDDGTGRCCAIVTGRGERIDCQLVGLTAGVGPNVDLVRETGIEVGRGVLVDWSLQTSEPDVYAAGDCAELRTEGGGRNLIQQVWYTGKMQGEVVADVMVGEERTYEPGIWFNSAKFLQLEYQTYGRVNRDVPGEQSLFWEHVDRRHSVRIVFTDEGVIGFNLLGLRYRHEVCERWLLERAPVDAVVARLEEANFDPELFHRNEREMRSSFRAQLRAMGHHAGARGLEGVRP